jgi:exonuclease III
VIETCGADIVMLQETKCTEFPPEIQRLVDYPFKKLFPSNVKKGHAGVAL